MEVRKELNKIVESQGFEPSDENVVEVLVNAKSVKEYDHDEHRWYTTFQQVVDINGRFFEFTNYRNSGDEPALDDEEWQKMVLDSVCEVYKKEVISVDYVSETAVQ